MCLASFFKILCLSYNKSHKIVILWLEKNNDALAWFGKRKPTCCLPPCALGVLSIARLFIAHNLIHQLITAVGDVTLANHRAGGGAAIEYIVVHPNASIVEDVISIKHNPDHAKISVVLRHDARCCRPFLCGWLSGPAMVVVKDWQYWDDKKTTNNNNAMFMVEATYPTPPEVGTYFLELIVIFCKNILIFTPPSMIQTNNASISSMGDPQEREMVWNNSYNFAQTCTEDASCRQLTSPNATITVLATLASDEGGIPPRGFGFTNMRP